MLQTFLLLFLVGVLCDETTYIEVNLGKEGCIFGDQFNNYDCSKKFYMEIHGWVRYRDRLVASDILEGLAEIEDNYNSYFIDWSNTAKDLLYYTIDVEAIGNCIGDLIYESIVLNCPTADINLVCISLGTHACGNTGRRLQYHGFNLTTIYALDPVASGFRNFKKAARLRPTDALQVVHFHTNDNEIGITNELGRVNFYANGGANQPGCNNVPSCNHKSCLQFMVGAVRSGGYESVECHVDDGVAYHIEKGTRLLYNLNVPVEAEGHYCFNTKEVIPMI